MPQVKSDVTGTDAADAIAKTKANIAASDLSSGAKAYANAGVDLLVVGPHNHVMCSLQETEGKKYTGDTHTD